jgi:hypothetical protein
MPDLLTHVVVAAGCREAARSRHVTAWFLVGTALPDLLTRPFTVVSPGLYWLVMPLHTPLGLVLATTVLSQLFSPRRRARAFVNLLGGEAVHLLLDALQKHIGTGYLWLFPFSWSSYEVGLFWPEESLYLLPLWVALAAVLAARRTRGVQRAAGLLVARARGRRPRGAVAPSPASRKD